MNGNGNVDHLVHDIEASRAEIRRKRETLGEAAQAANPVRRLKRSWKEHRWPWLAGVATVAALGVALALRRRPAPQPQIPRGYVVVTAEPKPSSWLGILAKTALVVARPVLGLLVKNRMGGK